LALSERYFSSLHHINTPDMNTYADDIKYILAEEGRYTIEEENNIIMNEGISAIDIDEMNGYRCRFCCWDEDPIETYPEDDEPIEPEYDIKVRGGENYHINKLKTKPHSPKSERKQKKEKRTKDRPTKESRCHKKVGAVIDL
jgi:hypothetical protein